MTTHLTDPVTAPPRSATAPAASPQDRPPRLSLAWWGLAVRTVLAVVTLFGSNLLPWVVLEPVLSKVADPTGQILLICAAYTLTCSFVVLAVWAWVRLVERRALRATGWNLSVAHLGWLALGTAVSCLVMGAAAGISSLLQPAHGQPLTLGGVPLWAGVLYIVASSYLLQGLPEELLFRGWLFRLTEERPLLTLGWTTAAFTIIHLASQGGQQTILDRVVYLALPLGFGILAGSLVLLTRSLWAAVGVHGGFHVAQSVLGPWLPAQPGPVWWLVVGACYLVATAVVLALWWRRREPAPAPTR